jgi:Tol biopolymer transport system component
VPAWNRLLYYADQETDDVYELYLVAIDDNGQVSTGKVNAGTGGRSVTSHAWAPTNDRALFVAGFPNGAEPVDLYVVTIEGDAIGDPVRVNGDLAMSGDTHTGRVAGPAWSPDGARIAYSAAVSGSDVAQLFAADVRGPGPYEPVAVSEGAVTHYAWSSDGTWLAYRAVDDGEPQLFAVDVTADAPEAVRVSVTDAEFADVIDNDRGDGFAWAPGSPWLAYISDQDSQSVDELYLVDLSSGVPTAPRRVNTALPESSDVTGLYWSPDGSRLGYLANPTEDRIELFVADVAGGVSALPASVSAGLYPGGYAVQSHPVWAPDRSRLAYFGMEYETSGRIEIFAVDLLATPSNPVRLNPSMPATRSVTGGSAACRPIAWSHDSTLVTYASDQAADNVGELWTVDWSSRTPASSVRTNGPLPENGDAGSCPFQWSPVEHALLYGAQQDQQALAEIFVVEASSLGAPVQANGELGLQGDVLHTSATDRHYMWSSDGAWIAYLADQDINERFELYLVPRSALGSSIRGSAELVALGDVYEFAWSP